MVRQQEGNGPWDSRATMVMASEVKFDFGIELSDLDYPDIHVHIASNEHLNFGGLRGHGDLQTASEVTSDLKIQLSDLNYLCCHVSLASKGLHEVNDTRRFTIHPSIHSGPDKIDLTSEKTFE